MATFDELLAAQAEELASLDATQARRVARVMADAVVEGRARYMGTLPAEAVPLKAQAAPAAGLAS